MPFHPLHAALFIVLASLQTECLFAMPPAAGSLARSPSRLRTSPAHHDAALEASVRDPHTPVATKDFWNDSLNLTVVNHGVVLPAANEARSTHAHRLRPKKDSRQPEGSILNPAAPKVGDPMPSEALGASEGKRLADIGLLASGYNIILGNPHGGMGQGAAVDPGFSTDKIFSVVPERGNTYDGWQLPKGMSMNTLEGCNYRGIAGSYFTASQYQADLALDVKLHESAASSLLGHQSFTGSAGFRAKWGQNATSGMAYVVEAMKCTSYQASWQPTFLPPLGSPMLDRTFRTVVGWLANGSEKNRSFVDTYGTHFVSSALMGGKAFFVSTFNSSSLSDFLEAHEASSFETAAGIDAVISLGGSVSIYQSADLKAADAFRASRVSVTATGIPSTPPPCGDSPGCLNSTPWQEQVNANPAPLVMTLEPITTLLSPKIFPSISNINDVQAALSYYLEHEYCHEVPGCRIIEPTPTPSATPRPVWGQLGSTSSHSQVSLDPKSSTNQGKDFYVKWKVDSALGTPVVDSSGFVYLFSSGGYLTAVDPSTGRQLWSSSWPILQVHGGPSPGDGSSSDGSSSDGSSSDGSSGSRGYPYSDDPYSDDPYTDDPYSDDSYNNYPPNDEFHNVVGNQPDSYEDFQNAVDDDATGPPAVSPAIACFQTLSEFGCVVYAVGQLSPRGQLGLAAFDTRGRVLWKLPLPDLASAPSSHLSPAVVVTTRQTGPAVTVFLGSLGGNSMAIDGVTGAVLWNAIPPSQSSVPNLPHLRSKWSGVEPRSSPESSTITGLSDPLPRSLAPAVSLKHGIVYFPSQSSALYALNASTGSLLWDATVSPTSTVASSPVVIDETDSVLIGMADGFLYGLDPLSGGQKFGLATGSGTGMLSSPAIYPSSAGGTGKGFFARPDLSGAKGGVNTFDPANGKVDPLFFPFSNFFPFGPVFGSDGTMYTGGLANQYSPHVSIGAYDSSTGAVKWVKEFTPTPGEPFLSSPLVVGAGGSLLFHFQSSLLCLQSDTA